ncbi:28S ribosomal protein S31, mitochondrial [Pseudomyrmex gracilis]|uniref:28S ribosomal protein S31, mitochondrial n=1 Tax=Pseudomyrmex gracilis TaxID=219809 RepID=UPI000994B4CA|nr:28S ribosomal protein S31, mitochondrial [Pseudomyrmex gracilis]
MLSSYILTKCNIRPSNGALVQWLNVTVRLCSSSSSSSSSSDSSDSDSDSEKTIPKKTHVESSQNTSAPTKPSEKTEKVVQEQKNATTEATKKPAADLNEYLNNMMKARKLEKTIDVAIKPKSKKLLNKLKSLPYEKQVEKAAEDVADTLGGDKTKTTSDLLEKVLASRVETLKVEQSKKISNLEREKNRQKESELKREESQFERKKSVIYNLLEEYKNRDTSASKKISKKFEEFSPRLLKQDIDIWNGEPSREFDNMSPTPSNIPELKTWRELEQRELKAMTTYPPANIFQEMILWTEQGKLWKFPIDNEQGMEEEKNVHFSEHVFMERHLKDWCPKSGPVRHFMELVCIGLSKNPYMTVQEKVNHIMWYKEYFESKRDLLKEIGAIGESVSKKAPEIQEA